MVRQITLPEDRLAELEDAERRMGAMDHKLRELADHVERVAEETDTRIHAPGYYLGLLSGLAFRLDRMAEAASVEDIEEA